MNEDLVIEVTRMGVQTGTGHVFGVMTVKSNGVEIGKFNTLERGIRFTNLKIGVYEMHHSQKRKGRKVPCLRPTNLYISSILIHDALRDDANELEGCIAPFIYGTYTGSAKAMDELWNLLGGYDKSYKKKVILKILNNVSGETRTAEQWIAQRKAKWLKNYQRTVAQ